jgi:protocatechuate 3,4-dioxygenase alpha subunit
MREFVYDVTDVEPSPGPTPSQTVGPFFAMALPYDAGPAVVGAARPAAIRLHGTVLDGEGTGVPDAIVEIWQADESGSFCTEPGIFAEPAADGFRGFGRSATDEDGHYSFTTVLPGAVPTTDGGAQAPHVAMSVFARGMLRRGVTRVYFSLDAYDPLLASVQQSRRSTMVASPDEGGYRFDVHLQGADETVFLDVR